MIDFYLRAADQTAMDHTLAAAGLIHEDGTPIFDVYLDRIGPYSIVTGYDGETPIVEEHPEYHLNARVLRDMGTEEIDALADTRIQPPATPYRVWV